MLVGISSMKKMRNHAIRSLPEGTDCLMVNRVEGAHVEENRWREMLKALGLTQRELAESIGLDRGYLSRIVNGRVEACRAGARHPPGMASRRRRPHAHGRSPHKRPEALARLGGGAGRERGPRGLGVHPLPTRRGAAQVASPSPRRASPSAMPDTLRLPLAPPEIPAF